MILKKIVLLGDEKSGKTTLLYQLSGGRLRLDYQPTIGVDFQSINLPLPDSSGEETTVKLQCWDLSGNERYRTVTGSYLRNTGIIIYVVDLTQDASRLASKIVTDLAWANESMDGGIGDQTVPILLVANKQDLAEQQGIDTSKSLGLVQEQVHRQNPRICFAGQYITSATKPLADNLPLQGLKQHLLFLSNPIATSSARFLGDEGGDETAVEMLPMWWVTPYRVLMQSIVHCDPKTKRAIGEAVDRLKEAVLGDDQTRRTQAIVAFTNQCDAILQTKYPAAKKALYAFALTLLCSVIALSIAMSFGITGIAVLATTAAAGAAAGAGVGLLSKNSVFKPYQRPRYVDDFVEAIRHQGEPESPAQS